MTHTDSAHEDSEDRFYAQFDSREVELMTLDELAAAFEAGRIHANTFVCREGESEWLTLAEVAGLGEDDEPAAEVVDQRPPMPERRPEMPVAAATRPPMPERRPEMPVASESRPPMPERRPEMNTMPPARLQQAPVPSAASTSSSALSYAPVTSNIDFSALDTDDELALRPKRRWGLVAAAAAALVVAGGGAVFALNGGSDALAAAAPSKSALEAAASHSQASLSLSNLQPTKPSEPAAAPSTPEPVAAAVPEAAKEAPKAAEFSDDMKQALLAADKSRQGKKAQKTKGRASAPAPARRGSKPAAAAGGFKSGGSAYDPLNGKL